MVALGRRLAAVWLIVAASADPESCSQEDGQCVTGDVLLQRGRERSAVQARREALEEDSASGEEAEATFIGEDRLRIGTGTDADAVNFNGPIIGGAATNKGTPLAAKVAKRAGGAPSKAEYLFYVTDARDKNDLKVAVVEVTQTGGSLFARTVSVRRGKASDDAAGAAKVAKNGKKGKLAPVRGAKGFGAAFVVGQACASNGGHCSRCSVDDGTCLICGHGFVLEGAACRRSCEAISAARDRSSAMNIVFVPSGFKGAMETWPGAVQAIHKQLAKYPLLDADAIDELNVFYAKDPAPDDDGGQCSFGCKKIPRLLCCNNALFERHVWKTCGSGFQVQIIVVHNSEKYGGAGGRIATTSINGAGPKVCAHEIGHSMFSLGDEYNSGRGNSKKHANCDQKGCPKWDDMITAGFDGAACVAKSCKKGQFFASGGGTIMKQLGGQFGPVIERVMCCKYLEYAGSAPTYCLKFNHPKLPRKLDEYCKANLLLLSSGKEAGGEAGGEADSYSLGETRYLQLANPVEWELVRQEDAAGAWDCVKVGKLAPGVYPRAMVKGDAEEPLASGTIKVRVSRGGAEVRHIKFNAFDTVEIPPAEGDGESEDAGEEFEAPEEREAINVVLEEGEECEVVAAEG